MSINKIDAKIRIKTSLTGGVEPTIGTSSNHTDGSWSANDIYTSEFFYNAVDNKLWIGGTSSPNLVALGTSSVSPIISPYQVTSLTSNIITYPVNDNLIDGGGDFNLISSGTTHSMYGTKNSVILGGELSMIDGGTGNFVIGGFVHNPNGSTYSGIIGGAGNNITNAINSVILGGADNSIEDNSNSVVNTVVLATNGVSATQSNTVYVPSLMNDDSGNKIRKKIIQIGDWNMNTDSTKSVAHGLSTNWKSIRSINIILRNDGDTSYYTAPFENGTDCFISSFNSTNINLGRADSGSFDSTSFDSTSYNRGWLHIEYIP